MGNDLKALRDILANCLLVAELIEGFNEVTFSEDVRTRYAVLHALVIIGEATKRLSPEVLSRMPEIPWGSIARMRDKVIHHYAHVDLQITWNTASIALPTLRAAIERTLNQPTDPQAPNEPTSPPKDRPE